MLAIATTDEVKEKYQDLYQNVCEIIRQNKDSKLPPHFPWAARRASQKHPVRYDVFSRPS